MELEASSSTEEPQDSTESNADVGTGTSEDIHAVCMQGSIFLYPITSSQIDHASVQEME